MCGVKSSGNQAECGLRKTAKLSQDEYPLINQIVSKVIYVGVCISGEKLVQEPVDDFKTVLNRGDFYLKGSTFLKCGST